ncbi:recombinase family protein [Paenibacillus elgii]|uniref:recombinase family protein n=1 Tax=Paenibacillus elgii TaxID=189691 RepID=UPI000248C69F|nr:recombinase family protein [Paenibacillus elgii]
MEPLAKAVIYARVSTEEQAHHGYSIQAQLTELKLHAEQHDMEIVDEYVDEGVSGKSINKRTQMVRLLKDAASGKFEYVLVYKLDRVARNLKDAMQINDELGKHNIKIIFLKDNLDTSTSHGKLHFQIMGSVAEFERNTIVDRVKMGMTQRARQGQYNGGICFGYNNVDKMLVVNEAEAAIVREIFKLAKKGNGYKSIIRL